jgi:hypothetical protein
LRVETVEFDTDPIVWWEPNDYLHVVSWEINAEGRFGRRGERDGEGGIER